MLKRIQQSFVAIALACISPAWAGAATQYEITNLGTLGGSSSFALDINNRGQVTGNASTASGALHAYRWENGVMTDLGTLPRGNDFSRGYALNDAGQVVGDSGNGNITLAFSFSGSGPMADLGGLGPSNSGAAHGVNNSGQIVGGSTNNGVLRPFLIQDGTMRDLGTLDGNPASPGRAWGINDLGQVVGFARTSVPGVSHAFLYTDLNHDGRTDPGEMIDLDASGDPNRFSQAFSINAAGHAVGEAIIGATTGGTSINNAFLWRDGTRIPLGTLGFTFSTATDINDSGLIVGNVTNISGSSQRAFLWQDGVMTDLNTLISPGSGWTLRSAEGINELGQIVGLGTFGNQTRAFLLSPVPEPSSLASLSIAISALVGYGWASRRIRGPRM